MRRALLAAALLLVLAAPARATYAPTVQLDVPTTGGPGSPLSVTATVTQAFGEEATSSVQTIIPLQFGTNPAFAAHACTAVEQLGTCPDSSRIGSVEAVTALGTASGPLYFLEGFRLLAVAKALGGLVSFKINGQVTITDGIIVSLTDIPNIPSTQMKLVFEGGDRSPLALPLTCDTHSIKVRLTSHAGSTAESDHPVTVSGCGGRLTVSAPRLSRKVLAAGGSLKATWTLGGAPAATRVELARTGRKSRSLGTRSVKAPASELTIGPRWRGRKLKPGRYRVVLTALDSTGQQSPAKTATFRVRR